VYTSKNNLKFNKENIIMTKAELVANYTKEQLADALLRAVDSEVSLLDNGCGNNLDKDFRVASHLKAVS
jgi:hypothetical protein